MSFAIKDGVCLDDMCMLHPNIFIIFSTILSYSAKHDLPVVITSLIHDRSGVKAASSTHSTGRAIDLSIRGWSRFHLEDIKFLVDTKHKDIAAISAKSLVPTPIIIHNVGHGAHIHIQVRR